MDINYNDIKAALNGLQARQVAYRKTSRYYLGDQDLSYATQKFRNTFGQLFSTFAENVCPVVVDTVADRLQVTGFTLTDASNTAWVDNIEAATGEIYRRNRLNQRQGQLYQEALRSGDSYCIVWPDETGQAVIYPQQANQVAVSYHPEQVGFITNAAKWWLTTEENGQHRIRLNLYYPDRIEKFATPPSVNTDLPLDARAFQPVTDEDAIIPNPWGKVPIFHFGNNAPLGRYGRSELDDIIPLQNALNKSVMDMLVAMEFSAYPQRYATGIEVQYDADGKPMNPFQSGADRLWIGEGENVKFGQFATVDLAQYIAVQDAFRASISRVSGIPMHYLLNLTGGYPSGESLKTSEARLTAKVKDRQIAWGNTWSDVMRFCLLVQGMEDVELETQWLDTEPRNEAANIQNAVLKVSELDIPPSQVWAELGYGPKEVQLFEKLKAESDAAAQKAFDKGIGAQFDIQ